MKKVHSVILIFFIIVAVVLIALYYLSNEKNSSAILYFGNTCPHCKIVEDFIKENNITSKFAVESKEVYDNLENALELENVAKSCNISKDAIGVPLLYYNEKCYVGDNDIITLLEKETGVK